MQVLKTDTEIFIDHRIEDMKDKVSEIRDDLDDIDEELGEIKDDAETVKDKLGCLIIDYWNKWTKGKDT